MSSRRVHWPRLQVRSAHHWDRTRSARRWRGSDEGQGGREGFLRKARVVSASETGSGGSEGVDEGPVCSAECVPYGEGEDADAVELLCASEDAEYEVVGGRIRREQEPASDSSGGHLDHRVRRHIAKGTWHD